MQQIKTLFLSILLLTTATTFAQSQELLDGLPTTKEEFIASEKKVLATIDWLENTSLNQDQEKRKLQNAMLVSWLTNSPTVTLEINADVLTFTKKNADLLIIFMGGWTRYSLQNGYSKDAVQGSIAGIKSAIKVYKTGLLKKDKEMQKMVDMDEKGELEAWVKTKLKK
ncbi:hypothetical protein WG954_00750 [Lacibacter sp. H375]|uniref:hypothetical protein n=1 Tax=Lacibacter sp. H375 TaxID=3133424 RepID=UPI0030C4F85B